MQLLLSLWTERFDQCLAQEDDSADDHNQLDGPYLDCHHALRPLARKVAAESVDQHSIEQDYNPNYGKELAQTNEDMGVIPPLMKQLNANVLTAPLTVRETQIDGDHHRKDR